MQMTPEQDAACEEIARTLIAAKHARGAYVKLLHKLKPDDVARSLACLGRELAAFGKLHSDMGVAVACVARLGITGDDG